MTGKTGSLLLFAFFLVRLADAEPQHPLDGLEADEIVRAATILRGAGHTDESTPILSLTLEPPAKSDVLDWTSGDPIPRAARAIVRRDRINHEIVIDLDSGEVVATETVPGPGQPTLVVDEIVAAIEATLADPEMQAGLTKRGIDDFDALSCAPRTTGNFGADIEQERRLVKVDCFDLSDNPDNVFAAPIEGLFAIVDIEAREVLDVIDLGVVPVTQTTYSLAADAQGELRDTESVHISSAGEGNVRIDGWTVMWNKWRFHLRWDARAGLIVSMVEYLDRSKWRRILYQGNVSEIYVPYQDPTAGWYYRNYLDEGDYGLGNTHSPLVAGADCPDNAAFLSAVMANAAGAAEQLSERICIFELPTGDATWRHYDQITEALDARPNVELVVRFIATVGNYDYLFDWVFDNKGQLAYRVGATGLDAVKGVEAMAVSDDTAAADTSYGPLIAPGLAGINHDHFFSVRLDIDVDGSANRFVRDKLVTKRLGEESERSSIWTTERLVAEKDSEAKFRLSYEEPSLWRVESARQKSALGYATSYALKPAGNARPLVDEDDAALARAQFANYHLWVTPFAADELWAAGRYSNQSPPGAGLPEWTSEGRDVEDTDIVLWYTLGFHHVPSSEDWPVYNLGWNSLTLRPYNFFDTNPAMDLPEAPNGGQPE